LGPFSVVHIFSAERSPGLHEPVAARAARRPDAPCTRSPHVAGMASLGELWYQTGSPFSLRAYWAIAHSRVRVKLVACLPLISTFLLWLRLGRRKNSGPLSLPILFPAAPAAPTPRPVRDSGIIARAADAMRPDPGGRPSLFPPQAIVDIDKFMRASDTLAQHGRSLLLSAMLHDPSTAAEVVLPRPLRGWFFVPALLRLVRARMTAKYPQVTTREEVRQALLSLRAVLARNGGAYICSNHLTYADICMCSCMYFAVSRRAGSAAARVYGDAGLATEFADLGQWRAGIFDKHYPGASEADAYKCKPPEYGD
jgi:glutathione S-transferase